MNAPLAPLNVHASKFLSLYFSRWGQKKDKNLSTYFVNATLAPINVHASKFLSLCWLHFFYVFLSFFAALQRPAILCVQSLQMWMPGQESGENKSLFLLKLGWNTFWTSAIGKSSAFIYQNYPRFFGGKCLDWHLNFLLTVFPHIYKQQRQIVKSMQNTAR